MMRQVRYVTECVCSDTHHAMEFILQHDPTKPLLTELFVNIQLNQRDGFLRRLWNSVGYVAGRRSSYSYGHWDTGSLTPEGAREVRSLIDMFLNYAKNEPVRGSEFKEEQNG